MDYRVEAGLWVALSLGLYGLWTFYLARLWEARKPQRLWADALEELACGLYFLGIPALALVRGTILPRFMGFTHLDWIGSAGPSIRAALFFALLLLAIRFIRGRAEARNPGVSSVPDNLKQALYFQMHWAFYRAFAIPLLGLQAGVLAGWAISLVEGVLFSLGERLKGASFGSEALWTPAAHSALFRLGFAAVATGVVFLFSRNFFYCLALHWLLSEMMGRLEV